MISLDLALKPLHRPKDLKVWPADLYSVKDVTISLHAAKLVRNNIGFKISSCYFGKIHSRSSWALKFTGVQRGVIDSDDRGPVSMIFYNFFDSFLQITEGNCFAQRVFQKIGVSVLREVLSFEDKTKRNVGAFGSTNNNNNI